MSVTKAGSSSSYDQGGSSSASSRMHNTSSNLPLSDFENNQKLEEESDEDMFTVPVVGDPPQQAAADTSKHKELQDANSCGSIKRRRGRNPVDREYRKLKRLLRNRVSAQEARERKKVYVSDMESRAQDLSHRNLELQDKVSTLINENNMMRKQVLANTRPKVDESSEPA